MNDLLRALQGTAGGLDVAQLNGQILIKNPIDQRQQIADGGRPAIRERCGHG
ncbi:hypothetical protein D3C72_1951370 [compost metagenome]